MGDNSTIRLYKWEATPSKWSSGRVHLVRIMTTNIGRQLIPLCSDRFIHGKRVSNTATVTCIRCAIVLSTWSQKGTDATSQTPDGPDEEASTQARIVRQRTTPDHATGDRTPGTSDASTHTYDQAHHVLVGVSGPA